MQVLPIHGEECNDYWRSGSVHSGGCGGGGIPVVRLSDSLRLRKLRDDLTIVRMDLNKLNVADLHHVIIRHVLDRGFVPTRLALASHFGVHPDVVRQALDALQAAHGVVLHPHQPEVWVIHPFSSAPTPFVVRRGGRAWWGNCAWCSLGIAALLGGDDVTIDTTFGAEGPPVTVHVEGGQVREDLWVHFPIPMARAWDNVIYTCSTMLVFESEAAIDTWSERHAIPRGSAQPIQRVYDFAEVWYGHHLDPDWRKWTAEEASGIFKRFGFEGPIWQLSHTAERF